MEYELDLPAYLCPLPLLMTQKALIKLASGDSLKIHLNHTSQLDDIRLLCEAEQYQIVDVQNDEDEICMLIKK